MTNKKKTLKVNKKSTPTLNLKKYTKELNKVVLDAIVYGVGMLECDQTGKLKHIPTRKFLK